MSKTRTPLPGQMEFGFMGDEDRLCDDPQHWRSMAAAEGKAAKMVVQPLMIRASNADPVDPVSARRYRGIAEAYHDAWEWGVGMRDEATTDAVATA